MRFRLGGLGHSRAIQIAVAAAVLVFAWPIRSEPGRVGIDINWQFGLYQAAENGLRFGRDLVFTYGPLGFLSRPIPFFGPASAVAFIVTAAIYLAFVSLLLHVALRLFPAWVAALVTLAFARGIGWLEPFETLQILAFGLGVEVLRRDQITSHRRVAILAGALAGFAILGKLNVGVF